MNAARLTDPDAINEQVWKQIRKARQRMGKSQREACVEVFGTPTLQGMWSRWEADPSERSDAIEPSLGTLVKIAEWAGLPLSFFAGLEEKASKR